MSLKEVLYCGGCGLVDSLKGGYWLYALDRAQARAHQERQEFKELKKGKLKHHNKEEPRLLNRVVQCCSLNGIVFGLSIVLFKNVLLPLLQHIITLISTSTSTSTFWSWLQFLLSLTFDSLWVLPLWLLSRVVNALWFQDIGTLAYRYSLGRPRTTQSLSTFIADNLFSLIIQALFLLQALLLQLVLPYLIGSVLSSFVYILHTSLLYSLYSFEYKWVQMGVPLHQRLLLLENNWPYFIGFGLPLSICCHFGDFVISGCLFAILFPVFIIAGNEGELVAVEIRRLKLFSGVVMLANKLFDKRNK